MSNRKINKVISDTITTNRYEFAGKKGATSLTAIDNNGSLINTGINIYNFSKEQQIVGSDTIPGDYFGYSVSIDGDIAVVGAYNDDDNGMNSGSAYIFEKSNGVWIETQKILASDGTAGDNFGLSVDIYGNTVVIGASSDNSLTGSAYIFEKSNNIWSQIRKLVASDGVVNDIFGRSVAINNNSIIVGSRGEFGSSNGSAYIFDKSNGVWGNDIGGGISNETQKIVASDGAVSDFFGFSVDISNNVAIVGAYADDDNGTNSGSAYIFTKSNGIWPSTETQKIIASDGVSNDFFGQSVAIDGDTIVVGAYLDDDNGADSGSAYIFDNIDGIWSQTQKIISSDGIAGDTFGISVAISNNYIIVGSNGAVNNKGSAYIFEKNNGSWIEVKKITPSSGTSINSFGAHVNISSNVAIIGTNISGLAYIYDNALETPSLITNELTANNFVGDLTFKNRSGDNAITAIDKNGTLINTGVNFNNYFNEQIVISGSTDQFGRSVAIYNNTIIIGASGTDTITGSAHIFQRINGVWTETQRLDPSDAAVAGFKAFGDSVDISGNIAIIGAFARNNLTGSAYIFDGSSGTWLETQILVASDFASSDSFGSSVAIDGNIAVVGAYDNDDNGSNSGSAYIFENFGGTWYETKKLTASDAVSFDNFGFSVDISGSVIVIGAQGGNGSAYIFEKIHDVWIETQKLTASDAQSGDVFGGSVAIDNNIIIVGAKGEDALGSNSGSAYIFEKINGIWRETQKIKASDPLTNRYFGSSVSISCNVAIVGSDTNGLSNGATYVFEKIGEVWTETNKIIPSDGISGDEYGYSCVIEGNTIVVGAPENGSGKAYIYDDTLVAPSLVASTFNTGSGPLGGHVLAYASERNGGVVGDKLSFGANASDTHGITMPASGRVLYISISSVGPASTSIRLYKNNVATSDTVILSSSQTNSVAASTTFVANDTLGFQIITNPLFTIVGTFWVIFD